MAKPSGGGGRGGAGPGGAGGRGRSRSPFAIDRTESADRSQRAKNKVNQAEGARLAKSDADLVAAGEAEKARKKRQAEKGAERALKARDQFGNAVGPATYAAQKAKSSLKEPARRMAEAGARRAVEGLAERKRAQAALDHPSLESQARQRSFAEQKAREGGPMASYWKKKVSAYKAADKKDEVQKKADKAIASSVKDQVEAKARLDAAEKLVRAKLAEIGDPDGKTAVGRQLLARVAAERANYDEAVQAVFDARNEANKKVVAAGKNVEDKEAAANVHRYAKDRAVIRAIEKQRAKERAATPAAKRLKELGKGKGKETYSEGALGTLLKKVAASNKADTKKSGELALRRAMGKKASVPKAKAAPKGKKPKAPPKPKKPKKQAAAKAVAQTRTAPPAPPLVQAQVKAPAPMSSANANVRVGGVYRPFKPGTGISRAPFAKERPGVRSSVAGLKIEDENEPGISVLERARRRKRNRGLV